MTRRFASRNEPASHGIRCGRRGVLGSLLAALIVAGVPTALRAQVGPWHLGRAWSKDPHWADTFDDIVYFGRAETQVDGENARVFFWDSYGRIKFEKENPDPVFSLGYRAPTLSIGADDGVMSGQYNDVAVAGVVRLGELLPSWKAHVIGGMGTANDGHWSNTDALYGTGSVDLAREFSSISTLHLGVTYDGNGNLFPDIPLPYVNWNWKASDQLELWLGTYGTKVQYVPVPELELSLQYVYPVNVEADVEWEFLEGIRLFTQYSHWVHGFYIDGEEHRRYFYQHDRVGGGLRWITWLFDVSLGAGYSLDQRFRSGFDIRELDTIGDMDPGFYVFLRAQGTFSLP